MSGVGRVTYAARDPWAGCASMADGVPYLKRSGPAVDGPLTALEAPLVAWQTAVHFARHPDGSAFLDVYRDCIPEGFAAGKSLFEQGTLSELVRSRAKAEEVWVVLTDTLD
jgi:hypothetical protein